MDAELHCSYPMKAITGIALGVQCLAGSEAVVLDGNAGWVDCDG